MIIILFSHASIKSRSIRNLILVVKVRDIWFECDTNIRCEVVRYFSERVKELLFVRPKLCRVPFRSIFEIDNLLLTSHFLLEDLDGVVA